MKIPAPRTSPWNRREFLRNSSLAVVGGVIASHPVTAQSTSASAKLLRVGLIGCGGRGTGAAAQALAADPNVKLVAMADGFRNRLETSLATLQKEPGVGARIDVPESHRFAGFDGYLKVIELSDVVLLTSPPHFRPIHLAAAVDAGKHVFAEKPVAVDAPGVRKVLQACDDARRKNLSIVSGLQMRYSEAHRETVRRLHDGALGPIRALQANDYRGPIWVKPREPGWTDMEYHMHNWYYFTWLSGDFNVEQHVHILDLCAWIMNDQYPVRAYGTGGRQVRSGPDYGNIYDHHAVTYEYANGAKLFATCRQMPGCMNDISTHIMGAKGIATFNQRSLLIDSGDPWVYRGERTNAQQIEHDEFFASIRRGKPINNGSYMSHSTLMAIMGRMATYTGQAISWDQALNSQEDLSPNRYDWDASPPVSAVAIPGVTRLV
jgi:predicted dehydrogenase